MKNIADLDFVAELAIRLSHLDILAYPITTNGLWIHTEHHNKLDGSSVYKIKTAYNQYGEDSTLVAEFFFRQGKGEMRSKQLGNTSGFSVQSSSEDDGVALLIWVIKGIIAGLQI